MNLKDLKTIIREEMRTIIREELKDILTEAVVIASKPENNTPIHSEGQVKPFQEIMNTQPLGTQFKSTGNPLLDLLTETANEGSWRSLNGDGYSAKDAVNWAGGSPQIAGNPPIVENAEQMIAISAEQNKYVSNLEDVRIDAVPNFSNIMNKFKEQGSI